MKKHHLVLLAASLVLLNGCGGIESAKTSTITVSKDGIVTTVLMEDFMEEQYDASELESTINEWVTSYNTENGEAQVTLKEVKVTEGVAKVKMDYASDDAYRGFNQVDFFSGTVKRALEEGYAFAGDFVDAEGADVADGTIPDTCQDAQVMIIREPYDVMIPGKILYISKNMKAESKKLAVYAGNEDEHVVMTEAYGYVIYSVK